MLAIRAIMICHVISFCLIQVSRKFNTSAYQTIYSTDYIIKKAIHKILLSYFKSGEAREGLKRHLSPKQAVFPSQYTSILTGPNNMHARTQTHMRAQHPHPHTVSLRLIHCGLKKSLCNWDIFGIRKQN